MLQENGLGDEELCGLTFKIPSPPPKNLEVSATIEFTRRACCIQCCTGDIVYTGAILLGRAKESSNRRKHGISFDTAARVFLDPLHVSRQDRIVEGEPRWQTIGTINGVLVVIVAYAVIDEQEEFIRIVSARKPLGRSESNMKKRTKSKRVVYELKPDRSLTARQRREIAKLAATPEERIDTSDIPELPPGAWKNAVRGKWYRPVKQPVSIRLDADVLAWLKSQGSGYQTKVNLFLRERMLKEIGK